MSLQPVSIIGFDKGLQRNKKPLFIANEAFQTLENAYCYRDRIQEREGRLLLGRLRRVLSSQALGNTAASPPATVTITDIFTTLSLRATEPNAQIQAGSLVITVAAPDTATFTDQGNGTFAVTGAGVAAGSYVNYTTGRVVLQFTSLTGGSAITANINYYPSLSVMGIPQRDRINIADEQTIWFDQKYAYIWNGSQFTEFIAGTTWNASDSDLFWSYNYRGAAPQDKLMFTTNFVCTAANPIRYTDGATWTDFAPLVTTNDTLFQARILIAYYGRLLALNVFEGTTAGGYASAVNIQNRMRFSQLGSPIQSDAFRTDIFGKGGLLDAPTSEAIIGASFIKNTLVVDFEASTWQLRYVGEYGVPFIWERVSVDFGSESTFSAVVFDNHRLSVGDKAITAGNAVGVDRIDLDIPDQIFDFKNTNNGVKRVCGIRDYKRELVFWNYADSSTEASLGVEQIFPNKVLVYNYRNNTFAIFRDSVTAFGTFQLSSNLTWDSLETYWDSEITYWDDTDTQSKFPAIVVGDQQGFISMYGYDAPDSVPQSVAASDQPTLAITAIDLTVTPISVTSPNHNLQTGEIVYLSGMMFLNSSTFVPVTTDLNDEIYRVRVTGVNTFVLSKWSFDQKIYYENFSFTPVSSSLYVGGGLITLFPKLDVITKDINIFQMQAAQTKLSYIDFLMETTTQYGMTVNLNLNSSRSVSGNMLVGNKGVSTVQTKPFYPGGADYAWFRFYATLAAQYFNIEMTYNDDLMNQLSTHQSQWVLLGINAWVRPGGKLIF